MKTKTCLILALAAGILAAQQEGPELTGNLSYSIASKTGEISSVLITVGDGGSGPYKSVLAGQPDLKTHTIYRPRDLQPFGAALKLPVVAWANGACRNSSYEFRNFLSEIASHGFLVVAIGPAMSSVSGGSELPGMASRSSQLIDGVDWAIAENSRQGSPYQGKIDTSKVAVMGMSCGGLQVMEVSSDPRITTIVLWNSGLFTTPPKLPPAAAAQDAAVPGRRPLPGMPEVSKEVLSRLRMPVAYFIGGKSDIAHDNAADDFAKIGNAPVLFANREVGHYPATYREPRGGAFAEAGTAWLKWQLKGDQAAAALFTGANCGLCTDPKWTVEKKRIP